MLPPCPFSGPPRRLERITQTAGFGGGTGSPAVFVDSESSLAGEWGCSESMGTLLSVWRGLSGLS